MATISLQLPSLPPVEHVLKDEAITIGRMKGNTIALDDISVSLSHAKITLRDGAYFLKDLNSTNGTMVNGQSVTEVQLHDGDHVKFGEVIGRFHAGSMPAQNTAAAMVSNGPAIATAPAMPTAPPKTAPIQSGFLPRTNLKPASAKKSPSYSLIVKVLGLGAVGLLLWKLIFSAQNPAPELTQPDSHFKAVPAKTVLAEKPPITTITQNVAATAVPQNSSGETTAAQRIPALIQSLKSPDVAERRRAVAALNAMQTEALPAVAALREALKDSDSEVRTWAALSLISNRVYDKTTVPILIQALHHENPTLRQVACLSLALIPFDETEKEPVIAALTDCVSNDTNAEVRSVAVSALKMITHDSPPTGK
jgi:predicted component of type VI protein secretion system